MFGIFLLIVLNLAIGYALALYFHRPELFSVAWRFLPTALPPAPASGTFAPSPPISPAAVWPQGTPTAVAAVLEEPPPETAPKPELPPAEEPAAADRPIAAPLEVEEAVGIVRNELNRYSSELTKLDKDLTEHSDQKNSGYVQAFAEKFDRLSDGYIAEQQRNLDSIRTSENQSVQAIAERCEEAMQEHTAAINSTRENLALAAALAGPAASCRAFLEATGKMAEANQSMQLKLDRTLKAAARQAAIQPPPPPHPAPPQAEKGVATGASAEVPAPPSEASTPTVEPPERKTEFADDKPSEDPANFERAIAEFSRVQANFAEEFTIALVEIDKLDDISRHRGPAVAGRILDAVVKTLVAMTPKCTMATNKQRRQMLFFQGDSTSRETTDRVEQLRQRIEAAVFQHGDLDLKVTLTSGIAEASCREEPAAILKRLQEILFTAHRYGHNCTFYQQGEQWSPAIAPASGAEAKETELKTIEV